jgi:Protein of unknown function (DUF4230)
VKLTFLKQAQEWLRGAWLYLVLIAAAVALFYLAFNLRGASIFALLAAGVVFAAMVALFVAARRPQQLPPPEREKVVTTLLSPTVLLSEIRAAALVTYGHIGTVTVRKERARAEKDSLTAPLHDKLFGEQLVMDVGVRVVAGVNLKHLREEDIQINGETVQISLPPTKVLMVYVDESLTRVVSHKNGWFTGRDITLMDAARREAMEALVNSAIDKDLFDKAGQQAAVAIASIARSLGYASVKVTPTLPPIGQHYEELQDPSAIAKIIALPLSEAPRPGLVGED